MFQINDYVVYGKTGVCQIDGIKTGPFMGDVEAEYYLLHHVDEDKVTIMTPVSNRKIFMRRLTTRLEIDKLIKKMPLMTNAWIKDDRQRHAAFKAALCSGVCEEWMKMLKQADIKRNEGGHSKRLQMADEEVMKSAERLMQEEFSATLQIPLAEVTPYILSRLPQAV